jgi:hypothetical protein
MRSFRKAHKDGAGAQREDVGAIRTALAAHREEPAPWAAGQPVAMSSEETEALQKTRLALSQEARRGRAEQIKALLDLRNQAQGIADTAAQARDFALLPVANLEEALNASIKIAAMESLIAYIDEGGQRRFGGSWTLSR